MVKTVSKPIATAIKNMSATHPLVQGGCARLGNLIHKMNYFEIRRTNRAFVQLQREQAIEIGSEMIGEAVIFSLGAGIVIGESIRSNRKEQQREAAQNQRLTELEIRVDSLKGHKSPT